MNAERAKPKYPPEAPVQTYRAIPPWVRAFNRICETDRKQRKFSFAYWKWLHSRKFLDGLAFQQNPLTFELDSDDYAFFQTKVGGNGLNDGFDRQVRLSDSNMPGDGQMPGNLAMLVKYITVFLSPSTPLHIKEHLEMFAALVHEPSDSNRQRMGGIRFWPAGDFGIQSRAAATTIPVERLQFAQNGAGAMIELAEGAEIPLLPNQNVKFVIRLDEPVFITQDGLPFDGFNGVENVPLEMALLGWFFEGVRAA